MNAQVLDESSINTRERMLLTASLFVQFDKCLRFSKCKEQINRSEVMLLCRIMLLNNNKVEATKRKLLAGWRLDYKRLLTYLDRLSIKGYIAVDKRTSTKFGFRIINSYRITFEGLRLLRELNDQVTFAVEK